MADITLTGSQDDLNSLANQVRMFIDQEVPDVTEWNVNPVVLQESLRQLGGMIDDLEVDQAALQERLDGMTDPVTGVVVVPEWVLEPSAPTYLAAGKFLLVGDRRADYQIGDRVRVLLGPVDATTSVVTTVTASTYAPDTTTVTVTPAALTPQLRAIEYGLVRRSMPTDLIPDAVQAVHLAKDAVAVRNLQQNSVTDFALAPAAVKSRHIDTGAVLSAAIAPLQINSGHINDFQIITRNLGKYQVMSDNVGEKQIGAFHLADRTVTGSGTANPGKIADKTIAAGNIADHTITALQIAPNTITGNEVGYNTISGWHITDLSIGRNDIADGEIFGGAHTRTHIASRSILGDRLALTTVTGQEIADNAIFGGFLRNHIVDETIFPWKLTKYTNGGGIAWDRLARGNIRGSWNGVQNEIGQKTIHGRDDLADGTIPWYVLGTQQVAPQAPYSPHGGFTIGESSTVFNVCSTSVSLQRNSQILCMVNVCGHLEVTGNPGARNHYVQVLINGNLWTQRNFGADTQAGSGTQQIPVTFCFVSTILCGPGTNTFSIHIGTGYTFVIDFADIALLMFA
jgi:hypothetical protein